VHGIRRRGADGALNRARGIALARGPMRGRGTDAESGSNPSSTPARTRVRAAARQGRDDMRGPHVSLCWWRQAAGEGGLGWAGNARWAA
jgi:hypothetical protein